MLLILLVIAIVVIVVIVTSVSKPEEDEYHNSLEDHKEQYYKIKTEQNKVNIKPDMFTFEEAKRVMIGTGRSSCKAVYDFHRFFECAFDALLNHIPVTALDLNEERDIRQNSYDNPIERYKNLTATTPMSCFESFVAIDTETTGLDPDAEEIIEIAAIKFVRFDPVEMIHTYIKPSKNIPKRASDINGITDDMVKDSPSFSQIADQLQSFIKGSYLVAYNSRFDMDFLYASGIDLSKYKTKVFDVLAICKKTIKNNDNDPWGYPDNFKLSTICNNLLIGNGKFHKANADALACGILFIDLIKRYHNVENAFYLFDCKLQAHDSSAFY